MYKHPLHCVRDVFTSERVRITPSAYRPMVHSDVPHLIPEREREVRVNDNGAVSDSTLWESYKAVIRGHNISSPSSRRRASCRRGTEAELEEDYRNRGSEDTLSSILKVKYEYNHILGEQIGNYIRRLKQKHLELGEKADKLLARQLKEVLSDRAIHKMSLSTGQLLTVHKQINDRFFSFYSKLYTARSTATDTDIANFFNTLNIPVLSESARRELDSEFTLEEIRNAICSFPSGKACGPDGFGIEFYNAH